MQQQSKILREKRVFGGAETVDSERQCTSKKSTRGKIHARRIAYNAKESSGDKYSASYLSKKPVIDLTPVKIVKQRQSKGISAMVVEWRGWEEVEKKSSNGVCRIAYEKTLFIQVCSLE